MTELNELTNDLYWDQIRKYNAEYSKEEYSFEIEGYLFEWCSLCKTYFMRCPKCGNNSCNSGWGNINGKTCDICPEAYKAELDIRKRYNLPTVPTKNFKPV